MKEGSGEGGTGREEQVKRSETGDGGGRGQDTSSVSGRMTGLTFALQSYWKLGMGLNAFLAFPSARAAEHGGVSGVCVTSWVDCIDTVLSLVGVLAEVANQQSILSKVLHK